MAADSKHLYLVARGDYTDAGLADESWQCGIRLFADTSVPDRSGDLPVTGDFSADDVASTPTGLHITSNWKWYVGLGSVVDPSDYLENQAYPAWSTFISQLWASQFIRLNELRLYPILGDGNAFESRVAVCSIDTPVVGGRSGTIMPLETSIVVSWHTSRPGPRGRGRIYLPPSSATAINTTGGISSTLCTDLAADAVDLLHALTVDPVSPTDTHVSPIVTGKPWSQYALINQVGVGNVWDAQRRRRRQISEAYTTASV